jgi:hypothetical protein
LKLKPDRSRDSASSTGAIKQLTEQLLLGANFLSWQSVQRHAATLRAGGAMNSGPTGSLMVSRRILSISALADASSDQPVTSSTGCN